MLLKYKPNGIELNGEFIDLEVIRRNCVAADVKENKLGVLNIQWDSVRGFDGLIEKYVAPIQDLKVIDSIIRGKEVYFGEIAGKHSKVFGKIEDDEMVIITNPDDVIEFVLSCPSKHEYTYSFLECFYEKEAEKQDYPEERNPQLTKEEFETFEKLLY